MALFGGFPAFRLGNLHITPYHHAVDLSLSASAVSSGPSPFPRVSTRMRIADAQLLVRACGDKKDALAFGGRFAMISNRLSHSAAAARGRLVEDQDLRPV
jgi:hypothetical protein